MIVAEKYAEIYITLCEGLQNNKDNSYEVLHKLKERLKLCYDLNKIWKIQGEIDMIINGIDFKNWLRVNYPNIIHVMYSTQRFPSMTDFDEYSKRRQQYDKLDRRKYIADLKKTVMSY